MKVLIVNTSDVSGGAARATYRIHKSLLKSGVDSQMMVAQKYSSDPSVIKAYGVLGAFIYKARRRLDSLFRLIYRERSAALFSPSITPFSNFAKIINRFNPDIVHIHWVCAGMLDINELKKLNAPVVWGLLDMWAFTGGCHYDEWCGLYKKSCGNCKVLKSRSERDLSRFVFNKKSKVYKELKSLTIVGHSIWLANSARESSLFSNRRVENIPSTIDVDLFLPIDKNKARKLCGLPLDKKLILYGAVSATSDRRKGFQELSSALTLINKNDVEVVIFGTHHREKIKIQNITAHCMGKIESDEELVNVYSAADVMVVPSLQENLANTILESMSCKTPVVSFNIGGNPDMVDHKKNGYLSKPFSVEGLALGIDWVLSCQYYDELCNEARKKIISHFNEKSVALKYKRLYEQVMSEEVCG